MIDLKVTDSLFELLRTVFKEEHGLSQDSAETLKENLAEIYEISKRNDMAHLVGFALEQTGLISADDEHFAKFQKQQYLAIYRFEGMNYELERLRATLEAEEIPFIALKGAVLRRYYPEGWMRTSSDIDVLVPPNDLERAENALLSKLKYTKGREGFHDHSLHSEGGVHVELHFDLLEDDRANKARELLADVWDYATVVNGKEFEHELSDGMFYFYHIAHLAKHVQNAGSGMRPFLDLWLINNRIDKDPGQRDELLKKCSLEKFAALCDELSAYWFDGRQEISESARKLEAFILDCGIYGSMENGITMKKMKSKGTVSFVWSRLFIPYENLTFQYPVIKKHKWLTPFCQIARWFRLLSGKMLKKAVREVKISNATSSKDVENMQAFLSEIGL